MNKNRLILLTAYKGNKEILKKTILSIIRQLDVNDIWIIVLDNQSISDYDHLIKEYDQLIIIKYSGPSGAGSCRNIGLDYIIKKISGEFLLLPIDGDDTLTENAVRIIKDKMINNKFEIITFGHRKIWPNGTERIIRFNGIYGIKDLMYNFNTVLGCTIIKFKNIKILKHLRFSSRYRANDLLFFFQAVDYFGKYKCYPEIILNSSRGNINSLSGKKFKMPLYRFLALKDFGINNTMAIIYTITYIIQGIRKYVFKQSL